MEAVASRQADDTLDELEDVLARERTALRTLDAKTIEETTAQKLALDARLRELGDAHAFASRHKARIATIRDAAVTNQLLLAHARACIRGAIAFATGQESAPYSPTQPTPSGSISIRVDVRG